MGRTFLRQTFGFIVRRPQRRAGRAGNRPLEALESRLMLAGVVDGFEQHFDFGTAASPLAADNVRISAATRYTAEAGYGWSAGSVQQRDRGATHGDERIRDFNFTSDATFAVDVPVGVYEISLAMGDGLGLRDEMGIFLEDAHVDTVSAAAGQYEMRTFTVTVTDGQLSLRLQDLGGANNLVMINWLDVVQIAGDPYGPQVQSVTPGGEVFDTLPPFTITFNEEIDAASFTADDVTLSGPDGTISPVSITQIDAVTFEVLFATPTSLGGYTLQFGPDILDLDGNAMNQDGDELNGEPLEDAFSHSLVLSEMPEFLQTYDFGTSLSPVGDAANQVTQSTTYTAESGFGWTEGTLDSRDRGVAAGDELTRDFNLTEAGTFVVDVLPEHAIYDVTLTMGDFVAARDQMGVFLEAVQVDTVSTAAGASITRTFRVTVTDGQLTLRLEDLGGDNALAVINSLQVRHVETVSPPDDDPGDGDPGDGDPGEGDPGDGDPGEGDPGDGDPGDDDDGRCRRTWRKWFHDSFRRFRSKWRPSDGSRSACDPPGHQGDHHDHHRRHHRDHRGNDCRGDRDHDRRDRCDDDRRDHRRGDHSDRREAHRRDHRDHDHRDHDRRNDDHRDDDRTSRRRRQGGSGRGRGRG